jgi:hypothetical protein
MRTTEELVGKIIEIEDGVDVTPFIDVANELVTERCIDSNYTEDKLIKIETWLAAHFFACTLNKQTTSEKVGDISENYQSKIDLGLNLTHYGQMAMQIDTAGNLAILNKEITSGRRKVVGVTWLGTSREETVEDYNEFTN